MAGAVALLDAARADAGGVNLCVLLSGDGDGCAKRSKQSSRSSFVTVRGSGRSANLRRAVAWWRGGVVA